MFIRRYVPALAVVVLLAACSSPGGSATGADPGGGGAGPAKADGFEGSITTSGAYAATWSAAPGAEAGVFNSYNSVELASDHQTAGYIGVKADGSIQFGSGANELGGQTFTGTGAKVTLDSGGQNVCAFTVDTDLAGTRDGATLHLKGGMTVHWHPQGLGDLSCP